MLSRYATTLIIISVILALILGVYTPHIFTSIAFIGDVFINLLKLFALPLICSALIVSLGNLGTTLGKLKKIMRNTIGYMLISEICAVTIALLLFNIFHPGVGVDPQIISVITPADISNDITNQHHFGIDSFVLSIIPHNIFESLTKFELLPVVIFSIIFGIACSACGNKSKPILELCTSIRDVSNTCLHWVMLLAPIGIFILVGVGIAQSSLNGSLLNNLTALISFVSILLLGLFIHAIWQLALVSIISKISPLHLLKTSIPVFSTAFATSSSIASLPSAIAELDTLQIDKNITRFMLPLCASINIGGMMIYEVAAALFFSQVMGIDLSIGHQILIAIACILCGMAAGGIPETSLVSLVIIFKIVNVPLSAISILLPLDRILDRIRTMVNIFGNMCGVIVVSKLSTSNKDKM